MRTTPKVRKVLLAAGLSSFSLSIVAPADEPLSRMSLQEFSEYDKRIDANGDGEIDASEDQRSDAAKSRLEALRRGVRVMKSRRPSDPTSWFFQAAIHGVADDAVVEAADRDPDVTEVDREVFWNQCPHNGQPSADFIVWHRAYLYHFERILREASGDPTLSVPYWDYTGGEAAFPVEFSDPEIPDGGILPRNPLHALERNRSFVSGRTTLSPAVTTSALQMLLAEKRFFGPTEDTGFAGGVYDEQRGTMGLLERRPHNDVHVALGGIIGNDQTGLMAEVQTAAFDPIFWVHHANIDRLCEIWLREDNRTWGYFPNAAWFVERPWFFYDADGFVQNQPRHSYLSNRNLGVTYDDIDKSAPALTDSLPFELPDTRALLAVLPTDRAAFKSSQEFRNAGPQCECCRVKKKVATVRGLEEASIQLSLLGSLGGSVAALSPAPKIEQPRRGPQVLLEISFLPPRVLAPVGYGVFLQGVQSEEGKEAVVEVGSLSIFGAGHHADHDGSGEIEQTINVTEAIEKLENASEEVRVLIRPYSLLAEHVETTAGRAGEIMLTHVAIRID